MSDDTAKGAADSASARPRGRRPRSERSTRSVILHAAAEEFAEFGYDAVSLRAIARRAKVDPALIHHYFDDKATLFAATIDSPVRPDRLIAIILEGPREGIGEQMVRWMLREWDKPEVRRRGIILLRGVLGQSIATNVMRQFLIREVLARIARAVDSPDAELRAQLAASQLVGLLVTRYVIELSSVASASADELAARVGPAIQWHLTGEISRDGDRPTSP